jgi:two-component system, cell cycle sensor histidine kinase and response regulator CckA
VVLVVDDEPLVLRMTTRILLDAGYDARAASSGAEALVLVEALPFPPALLVTDVQMHPMDGPELARVMRDRYPGTSVLYVSGYPDHPIGEGELLRKPFKPAVLTALVGKLLMRHDSAGTRPTNM